jgi:hypothetical protein
MNCIFEFFSQDSLARISRHLEQEEAGVTFRQKIIRRIVLVHDLQKNNNKNIYNLKKTKPKAFFVAKIKMCRKEKQ